jgi:hypothetical protein
LKGFDADHPDHPTMPGKGRIMSVPAEFRHPELFQLLPWREHLRSKRFPSGADGFVVEDLDVLVRWWGHNFQLDDDGTFALVEMKYDATGAGPARLPYAQERTFELLDGVLRRGDPDGTRYRGCYVVQYGPALWPDCRSFRINGRTVTRAGFDDFFLRRLEVEPLFGPR